MRRLLASSALGLAVVVAVAGPASADPAEPTNYRSIVTSVDPVPVGVAIEVVGGDAFLSVAAAEGHTVLVPGYFGEPYLRIDPDGAVYLNTMSPARYINQDRYGTSNIPEGVDAGASPVWEQVASGGRFAWHDHRVHWMSVQLPPSVSGETAQLVFPWTIRLFVDGVETEVKGELFWFPSTNPAGPMLIGVVGVLPFLAWRPGRYRPIAVAAAVVGALILMVATAQFAATPGFDRGLPIAAIFPIITIASGVGALWLDTAELRTWAWLAIGGLALVWWTWGISGALTAPVLPSAVPAGLERGAVSLAGWVGAGITLVSGIELGRATKVTAPVPEERTA
jgi:hypothetical protein